ncbi:MAG: protein translocase subunit SecD [Acidobacteriota bacterium]
MTNLRWRFLIIGAMVLLAVYFVYPPAEKVKLGLDLKGGIHLVLEVHGEEAVEKKVESDVESVKALLSDNSIPFEDVVREGQETIRVKGMGAGDLPRFRDLLAKPLPEYKLAASGPQGLLLTLDQSESRSIKRAALQQTLETIRNRVDAFGVAEPNIQQQGFGPDANRILIQLPGVEDPETVIDVFKKPAFLEWKMVSYPPTVTDYGNWNGLATREQVISAFGGKLPSDTAIYEEIRQGVDGRTLRTYWPLKKASPIKGNDLKNAQRGQGQFGEPVVEFTLTPRAGLLFEDLTRQNVGRKMAIVLDGVVLSAPTIRSTIADRGQIESNFTIDSADVLALQLKSGALPASLTILEERTVGPSLGMDSIRKGVLAALLGFGLVMLFMVFYYRLSGINAIVALLLNLLLVLAVMSAVGATLTLPGIAGLILTIGMAVDANVLIFERIREEIRNGKSVRASVEGGFSKALSAIVDSNVTTVIAALFLFQYGTGPIRGFAVTLMVGIGASMITALFVSRSLFMAALSGKSGRDRLSI